MSIHLIHRVVDVQVVPNVKKRIDPDIIVLVVRLINAGGQVGDNGLDRYPKGSQVYKEGIGAQKKVILMWGV